MKVRYLLAAWLIASPVFAQQYVIRATPKGVQRYHRGIGWVSAMATTSWLGTADDDFDNVNNFDNGKPVDDDTLLFPENATQGPATNMDAYNGDAATGTFTMTGDPSAADTVTINGDDAGDDKIYTWRAAVGSTANEVLIEAAFADSATNLINAINGGTGSGTKYGSDTVAHDSVSAATGGAGVVDITSRESGTTGNDTATTESTANATWGGATLSGGADFLLALLYVGRGFAFDIGASGSPIEINAAKFVHQGNNPIYWRVAAGVQSGSSAHKNETVIVNSSHPIGTIPALSISGIATADFTQLIVARGYCNIDSTVQGNPFYVMLSWDTSRLGDSKFVTTAPGNIATLLVGGGQGHKITTFSAISEVKMVAGSIEIDTSVIGAVSMYGGYLQFDGFSMGTPLYLVGGIVDLTQSTRTKTIPELFQFPGGTLLKSDDLVTITLEHDMTGGDTP